MIEDVEFLEIPGADEALVGYVWRCGQEPFAVYDRDKLVAYYVTLGMTEEDAAEWVTFNIEDAWVGPGTPAVLQRL